VASDPKTVDAPAIPAGFVELPMTNFVEINGPLYGRWRDGRFTLGLRVERRHCNPLDICHGGMLMTLADMALALGANIQADLKRFAPTVRLEGDFLEPARIGDWVEGNAEVLRVTRNLVFVQGRLTAGGRPIMRASAILKLPAESDERFDLRKFFE
jgi:uncharacterized protein (TIGR00369 family)